MVAFASSFAPSETPSPAQNRVGDFFWPTPDRAGVDRLGTGTASGKNAFIATTERRGPSLAQKRQGTRIAVVYNGSTLGQRTGGSGATSSGNPGGHVAIAVEGEGVYSFGNSTEPGSSFTAYMSDQAGRRDSLVIVIETNADQQAAVLAFLQGEAASPRDMGILAENCSAICNEALAAGGLITTLPRAFRGQMHEIPATTIPIDTRALGLRNMEALGGFHISVPRSQDAQIPGILNIFNPGD